MPKKKPPSKVSLKGPTISKKLAQQVVRASATSKSTSKEKPKPKGRLMRLTKDEVQVVLNYRAERAMATDHVHACHYSSQPYVTVLCEQREYYVYQQPDGLPEGVYRADWSKGRPVTKKNPLYTFDDNKVTCPACLAKIKTKVTPVST